MSGRMKHMERSHRSYRNHDSMYRSHIAHAYSSKSMQRDRKSLSERFASIFATMMSLKKMAK